MKRLQRKLSHLARKSFYDLRAKRRNVFAEWISSDPSDPNLVQNITDIMAGGGQIQIQYNGEYKTILPYGWNSSKEGNVLLMCYKDTGEVRSYRLDRVTEVLFDSDNLPVGMQEEGLFDDQSIENNPDDMGDIPQLPDEEVVDEFSGEDQLQFDPLNEQELPFDDALEIMDEDVTTNENPLEEDQQDLNLDEDNLMNEQTV